MCRCRPQVRTPCCGPACCGGGCAFCGGDSPRRRSPEAKLERARAEIDRVDAELVTLLNRRAALSRGVIAFKATLGLPPHDPAREAAIVAMRLVSTDEPATRELLPIIVRICREHGADALARSTPSPEGDPTP